MATRIEIARSRGSGQTEWLRSLTVLLVLAWAGLGLMSAAESKSLLNPITSPPFQGDRGFVGYPLAGAQEVSVINRLLAELAPAEGWPVLVVVPDQLPEHIARYVRIQLLYSRYPQRVDVVTTSEIDPNSNEHRSVVTPPGFELAEPWVAREQISGITHYSRGET